MELVGYTELKITLCSRKNTIWTPAGYVFFVGGISNYAK
jgi:hypothetical protein